MSEPHSAGIAPFRESTLSACRVLVARLGYERAVERTERDIDLFRESGKVSLTALAGDRLDCLRWMQQQTSASVEAETERRAESLVERIAALPEQSATSSRDYGRGYARAIKDVLDLLEVQ